MNFFLASLATKVLREKSCKVKSCVLRDARLVPTIASIDKGIHKAKSKAAQNEKQNKKLYGFSYT